MTDTRPDRPGHVAAEWSRAIHPREDGRGGDRAALARLRRATSPVEALVDPAAVDLVGRLRQTHLGDRLGAALRRPGMDTARLLETIGLIAAVLAAAPPPRGPAPRFAEALGRRPEGSDRPRLSPLRFAALLNAPTTVDRLRRLRRAVAQLDGGPFDVASFAEDLLRWGDVARIRWTFEYHQEARAVPASASADRELSA